MKSKPGVPAVIFFLLALALIFGLTVQNSEKSGELSMCVQKLVQELAEKVDIDAKVLHSLVSVDNHNFRKYAHTAEFFLLGLACGLLFRKSGYGFWKALFLCAVISFSDQSLKLFVPGREFDWTDFPYDAVGYFVGTGVSAILRKISAGKRDKY